MLNLSYKYDVGSPTFGFQKRYWVGALVGALGGIAGSYFSSQMQKNNTMAQQRLQSKLNREEMSYSNDLQRNQQEWLMNAQYGKTVQGMKNAGLNPATANGTTPSVPSASTPHSGSSGPSASMPNIVGSASEAALLGSQIENIQADTKKKEQEAKDIELNRKIKEWEADPSIVDLKKRGLSAEVLKTYAESDLLKDQAKKVSQETANLCAEYNLTRAQTQKVQMEAAKMSSEINKILQDISESEARIVLHMAETNMLKSQTKLNYEKINTEKAQQSNLYASSEHHLSSAGAEALRGNLDKERANESRLQQKALEISNQMQAFEAKVQAYSGDPINQGAIRYVKNVLNAFNPLSGILR